MKIRFLATGIAPDKYEFDGEKIKFNGEWYDLSEFEEGDVFLGIEGDIQGIRAVERIDGELYVTLCQKTPPGHWTGKDMPYIDASEYDPNKLYIREKTPEEIEEDQLWGI
jgi:hypothetical protein